MGRPVRPALGRRAARTLAREARGRAGLAQRVQRALLPLGFTEQYLLGKLLGARPRSSEGFLASLREQVWQWILSEKRAHRSPLSMKPCDQWRALGLLFGEDRVQVSIHRTVSSVPPGKKRARTFTEPVVMSEVMSVDAWRTLSEVLRSAGAAIEERERGW